MAGFGGTTPYVVTWLTGATGNNLAPALYLVVASVVSVLTVLTLRESAAAPLPSGIEDHTGQQHVTIKP